jgi:hypothetical protein
MTIMRPPQQGQGCDGSGGPPSSVPSASPVSRGVEELTRSGDVLGSARVGEEPIVTDAMETGGQHMEQEAADELVDGERHDLEAPAFLGAVILPPERHASIVERDEAAVGDGDTVRVRDIEASFDDRDLGIVGDQESRRAADRSSAPTWAAIQSARPCIQLAWA